MRLALAAERSRANAPALASGKQVPTVDLHQRDMLRLATIDGARVWHLEDEIGTLTPGKQAVKRDGKLAGDHVGHVLELMHAARERLRA
jgi:hypothetical protein